MKSFSKFYVNDRNPAILYFLSISIRQINIPMNGNSICPYKIQYVIYANIS